MLTVRPLYQPRPARWPQISLKGFFVLVTVFGVWLGVQVKWIQDRHVMIRDPRIRISGIGPDDGDPIAPLSIRVFGEPGYGIIWIETKHEGVTADEENALFERVRALFPEAVPCFTAVLQEDTVQKEVEGGGFF